MKKLFLPVLFVLSMVFAITSCTNYKKKDADEETSDSTQTDEVSAEEQDVEATGDGKYEKKSGMVAYDSEMSGVKTRMKYYFDDYGARECTEMTVEMDMNGQKKTTNTRMFEKDGYYYVLNMDSKTGSKTKDDGKTQQALISMDIDELIERSEADPNVTITEEGTEDILGKECRIINVKDNQSNMSGKYWIYDNIPLKMVMEQPQGEIQVLAVEFEEDAEIPAELFEVPVDFEIKEMNME